MDKRKSQIDEFVVDAKKPKELETADMDEGASEGQFEENENDKLDMVMGTPSSRPASPIEDDLMAGLPKKKIIGVKMMAKVVQIDPEDWLYPKKNFLKNESQPLDMQALIKNLEFKGMANSKEEDLVAKREGEIGKYEIEFRPTIPGFERIRDEKSVVVYGLPEAELLEEEDLDVEKCLKLLMSIMHIGTFEYLRAQKIGPWVAGEKRTLFVDFVSMADTRRFLEMRGALFGTGIEVKPAHMSNERRAGFQAAFNIERKKDPGITKRVDGNVMYIYKEGRIFAKYIMFGLSTIWKEKI